MNGTALYQFTPPPEDELLAVSGTASPVGSHTITVPFLAGALAPFNTLDLGTLNAVAQGDVFIRVAASQNITFTTTVSKTGTPQYAIDCRIVHFPDMR